jgi:hypothetical protein
MLPTCAFCIALKNPSIAARITSRQRRKAAKLDFVNSFLGGETMALTYMAYLENERKLAQSARNPDRLMKRFFELHAVPEGERDRLSQVEYETLEKALRARWRAQQTDERAKKLLGKIEAGSRKTDAHAKILLGAAAMQLAKRDAKLRMDLLTAACAMPSANGDYLAALLEIPLGEHPT